MHDAIFEKIINRHFFKIETDFFPDKRKHVYIERYLKQKWKGSL